MTPTLSVEAVQVRETELRPPVPASDDGRGRCLVVGVADARVHVGLDLHRAERAVVDPHLVDLALEPLGPERGAADLQRTRRGRDRARRRQRSDRHAVEVERQRRAVVRAGEVRPGVQRRRRRAAQVAIDAAGDRVHARSARTGARVEPVDVVARLLLEQHGPPVVAERGRPNPGLERHLGREVEALRVGDVDDVVDAVERQRAAVLAGAGPGRAADRAVVPGAGEVGQHRARSLVEAVRGDEPDGRCGGHRHARLVGRRADVPGGVLGGDPVVVGAGCEAGVGVTQRRHLRDAVAGRRREAGGGGPVDVVAGDGHVVAGRAPGESRAACARAGAQRARRGRRDDVARSSSRTLPTTAVRCCRRRPRR